MYLFRFTKERGQYLLDCLHEGKPIEPNSPGGWDTADAVQTAGALLYHLFCSARPPHTHERLAALPTEHQEAVLETTLNDLCATIRYVGFLVSLVDEGEYDKHFEPQVRGRVTYTAPLEFDVEVKGQE
ncbi:MAG: hypothetical protein ACYSWU_18710 [Planctomycetota bacterium]